MTDSPKRRLFSLTQKRALYAFVGATCESCGIDLEQGWHAHHTTPFARGGPTTLANARALCQNCHKLEHKKMDNIEDEISKYGGFKQDYGWQERACERFNAEIDKFYSNEKGRFEKAFVVEVSPSGGKTIFSLKLATSMIEKGLIDKAIWLVPRDSIKLGFQDDTVKSGAIPEHIRLIDSQYLRIDTNLFSGYNGLLPNYHGAVITYQALPNMMQYLDLLSGRYRLMFIFDEAHHGASGNDEVMNVWGRAMEECRRLAHSIVCMSGTPLRSDQKRIPYMDYKAVELTDPSGAIVNGFQVQPDYSFNYQRAVTAGIARRIICRSQDPDIEYTVEQNGKVETHLRPISAIPEAHLREARNTALCWQRGVVDQLLHVGFNECEAARAAGDGDAAILVIGKRDFDGTNSLDAIQQRISELFGEEAVIVESKDDESRDKIRCFKSGKQRWLVAKEMVSEGTNLPRLRVVIILRDIGNQTFYDQLVHRITRNDDKTRPQDAIIVQLKLRHLHQWAKDLENQARLGIIDRAEEERQRGDGAGGAKERTGPKVTGIASALEHETIVIEGEDFTEVDPYGRKIHAIVGGETRTSRWQIDKILKALPSAGIAFREGPDEDGELLSKEEEFQRRCARANQLIRNAGFNMGNRNSIYAQITSECKREAGITGKLENVLRDHPKPIEAIKLYERAAQRALYRSKEPRNERDNGNDQRQGP